MKNISKIIVLLLAVITTSCVSNQNKSNQNKWDGTWTSPDGKIVVTLDSYTMNANVVIYLGSTSDEPIKYTSKWEYIDDGIVYSGLTSTAATIIRNDGSLISFNPQTGRFTDMQIKMCKQRN